MTIKFNEKDIYNSDIISLTHRAISDKDKFKDYRLLKRKPESVKELHQYCMRTIIGIYRPYVYRSKIVLNSIYGTVNNTELNNKKPDFIQSTLDYRLRKRFNSIKFSDEYYICKSCNGFNENPFIKHTKAFKTKTERWWDYE